MVCYLGNFVVVWSCRYIKKKKIDAGIIEHFLGAILTVPEGCYIMQIQHLYSLVLVSFTRWQDFKFRKSFFSRRRKLFPELTGSMLAASLRLSPFCSFVCVKERFLLSFSSFFLPRIGNEPSFPPMKAAQRSSVGALQRDAARGALLADPSLSELLQLTLSHWPFPRPGIFFFLPPLFFIPKKTLLSELSVIAFWDFFFSGFFVKDSSILDILTIL